MTLTELLRLIPSVYADLESALVPRKGVPDDSGVRSSDPLHRPATADLDVIEHRHLLLRGLRWWVDAVKDPEATERVGQSVPLMCWWLSAHLEVMAPDDMEQMATQLTDWLSGARATFGAPEAPAPTARDLPAEALDQLVPQSVAAQALGVPVSTIWRRAGRGGPVRIREVMR